MKGRSQGASTMNVQAMSNTKPNVPNISSTALYFYEIFLYGEKNWKGEYNPGIEKEMLKYVQCKRLRKKFYSALTDNEMHIFKYNNTHTGLIVGEIIKIIGVIARLS